MAVDLRSDTVTRPDEGMRRAMYEAEVGDDVFGEDPTVRRLEETVAELLGKEAGLFVPTGVMGNQLALKVHTRPGDEVILERNYHVFNYESGAAGVLSGLQLCPVDGVRGILTPEQVTAAIRPGHYWEPQSRLLSLENTVNKAGGTVFPVEAMRAVAEAARAGGLAVHLDGARLWNAAVAAGVPERAWADLCDTVNVCLSKGLGAPVGSVLTGPADLIRAAHRFRKMFGGGMRQIGILGAAGLYALAHNRARLAEDHEKARRLAACIAALPAFRIDMATVETNIVIFDVVDGPAGPVLDALRAEGVWMTAFGPSTIRAITHLDVSFADVERACAVIARLYGR